MSQKFILNVILKALTLFVILNLVLGFVAGDRIEKLSFYNSLFDGRQRFTFGENSAQSYSLTTSNLDLLFGSHVVIQPKAIDEYRVFVLGDSSVWGTLLHPAETLTGQLNGMDLHSKDGRRMVFYNLAYPTISLWKDVLILDQGMQYQPDLIIWAITLESFQA